jgi:hypothetical protein
MKKFFTFLSFTPVLLLVFACDLQTPKAIQIKGSPELKFTANWEVDFFSDMMKSAFGGDNDNGPDIYECINAPGYKTFLIRIEIFNDSVSLKNLLNNNNTNIDDTNVQINNISGKYKLDKEIILASSSNDKISLPFSGFVDYLDGFKFKTDDIKSKLYVNGSDIVSAITIELTNGSSLGSTKVTKGSLPNGAHTTLSALPDDYGSKSDVFPADLLNNANHMNIGYKIYLAKNEEIDTTWLNEDHFLKAELVIWIPLVFKAGEDGAKLTFDSFKGIGDFLTSMSESGFIESLNFAVGMNANPFKDGTLVIGDSSHEIKNPMSANALNFTLNEEDVKYINENSFDPEFIISFERNAEIGIPKIFRITTVSLTAKLSYTVELGGN